MDTEQIVCIVCLIAWAGNTIWLHLRDDTEPFIIQICMGFMLGVVEVFFAYFALVLVLTAIGIEVAAWA